MSKIRKSDRVLPIPRQYASRRIWLVVQNVEGQANPKSYIDTMLSAYRGLATDLMMLMYDESANPKTLLGRSTLCNVDADRINGLTILEYIIRECHKIGIRFHAWFVMYIWSVWGGSTALLLTPFADDAEHHLTAGGGSAVNFNSSDVRSRITAAIVDCVKQTPGIDGINLDYIRYDGLVGGDVADVTQMVADIRAATRGKELSVCGRTSLYSQASDPQGLVDWVEDGLFDTLFAMDYWESRGFTEDLYHRMTTGFEKIQLLYGTGNGDVMTDATYKGKLYDMARLNRRNMNIFQYSTVDTDAEVQMVDDYISGRISISQTNITKLSITPLTSFTFALNGVDKTINHADVTDHTNTAALQAHLESVYGEQPFVLVRRPTSTTIGFYGRDFGMNS